MAQTFSGVNIFVTIGGLAYEPSDLNLIKMDVEDNDEGDNEIELVCVDNQYKIADSPIIRVGQTVSVKWGYTGGRISQERKNYILMKPSVKYDKEGVETTLKAYTKSAVLAARQPRKNYAATSVRQIVSEIAKRNGLALTIKGGNEQMPAFASANWSDRQTLRILADRYGYQITYGSDSILFAPVDYGAAPAITLIYGHGESSNIIEASLNVDAKKANGDVATIASGVDPATKTNKTATAGQAQQTLAINAETGTVLPSSGVPAPVTAVLGTLVPAFQFNEVAKTANDEIADVISHITSPDLKNLLATATGEKLKKQKKKGELSITSVGLTTATCRLIVTVVGLAKRDSGNWYVQTVHHDIGQEEGYVCKWELTRHGNNTKIGDKNTSPLNKGKAPGTPAAPTKTVNAETAEIGDGIE